MKNLIKIILLAVITVIFTPNFLHAAEMDFKYKTADEYELSIKNLRALISHDARNIPAVRIINQETPGSITLVNFSNSSGEAIKLVILNESLYVAGFISGGHFFRFNDADFRNINIPNVTLVPLGFSSSYSSLTGLAGISLSEVTINTNDPGDQNNLEIMIKNLFKYAEGRITRKTLATAMLNFVVLISESTRFSSISNSITTHIRALTPFQLGEAGSRRIESPGWISPSEFVNSLENNATSQASYVDAQSQYPYTLGRLNRSNLWTVIGVAKNCNLRSSSSLRDNFDTSFICPPDTESENVLVNNTYWPKILLINVID